MLQGAAKSQQMDVDFCTRHCKWPAGASTEVLQREHLRATLRVVCRSVVGCGDELEGTYKLRIEIDKISSYDCVNGGPWHSE